MIPPLLPPPQFVLRGKKYFFEDKLHILLQRLSPFSEEQYIHCPRSGSAPRLSQIFHSFIKATSSLFPLKSVLGIKISPLVFYIEVDIKVSQQHPSYSAVSLITQPEYCSLSCLEAQEDGCHTLTLMYFLKGQVVCGATYGCYPFAHYFLFMFPAH